MYICVCVRVVVRRHGMGDALPRALAATAAGGRAGPSLVVRAVGKTTDWVQPWVAQI